MINNWSAIINALIICAEHYIPLTTLLNNTYWRASLFSIFVIFVFFSYYLRISTMYSFTYVLVSHRQDGTHQRPTHHLIPPSTFSKSSAWISQFRGLLYRSEIELRWFRSCPSMCRGKWAISYMGQFRKRQLFFK